MAMHCCHKEYAEECEILVYVDAPAPHNPGLYQRLRFGLLASSWFPSPLGIFLWSALHVMLLIVNGPVFWVLKLLFVFLVHTYAFVFLEIWFLSFCVVYGLVVVAIDLIRLLVQSIGICWSLVGFPSCHEPIVEWREPFCCTIGYWVEFKPGVGAIFQKFWQFGVPCLRGSLYEETKDRKLQTWARWCEEVVHMHDAIAL